MALLDVSEILVDPDLADRFTVKRRTEVIDDFGRASTTDETFEGVIGVVTSANPNDLMRLPEAQRMDRNFCIVTKFRLIGPAPGKQPDTILWYGSTLVVKDIQPYPQYGAGFIQAIAGSMDIIDPVTP